MKFANRFSIKILKGWPSFNLNEKIFLENAGWLSGNGRNVVNAAGYFNIFISLNIILGFAEDCQKIAVNIKQELVLSSLKTDLNAIVQTLSIGADPTYGFKI